MTELTQRGVKELQRREWKKEGRGKETVRAVWGKARRPERRQAALGIRGQVTEGLCVWY